MNSQLVRLGFAGVLALALLGACAPPPAGEGAAEAPAAEKAVAPDFTLNTPEGEPVRLSDSLGKIRLIDFWATWCAPCREEIPFLNELQARYGERGFEVIAISDESADVVAEFIVEHGMEYLNLIGNDEINEAYEVFGLPSAYLLDADGKIVKTYMGPKPEGLLVREIEALLDARPAT